MAIKHRFDFTSVLSRVSTWAGILAGAASAALIAYATMPQRVRDIVPDWVLLILAAISVGVPFFNFLLTSYKQKNLGRATEVIVTQEVKVSGDISNEDAMKLAEAHVAAPVEAPKDGST